MDKQPNIKVWLQQFRANFLILSVFLVAIGVGLAYKYQPAGIGISIFDVVLVTIGTILAHSSVNLFNEYSDHKTGIDSHTKRTPFSGGSGMITQGHTSPRAVLVAAITTLLLATGIGVYFIIKAHPLIALIILIGGFSILFYTPFLSRYLLGELFAGLSLGSLVVLGAFIGLTATPDMSLWAFIPVEVIWLSVPPGILTALLLFLNEFPDVEADEKGGRRHLVIRYGKKLSATIYAIGVVLTFLAIFLYPVLGISSYWLYLALLPLPLAVSAIRVTLKHHSNPGQLIPAQGSNTMLVLAVDLFIAIAVFVTL